MEVQLSAEHEAFLAQQVEAGVYNSTSECLEDAVELLRGRVAIRDKIQVGLDDLEAGRCVDFDDKELAEHLDGLLAKHSSRESRR